MTREHRVLHIGDAKKFLAAYWPFLTRHFGHMQHRRLALRQQVLSTEATIPNVQTNSRLIWALRLLLEGQRADVIVIHGLKHEIALSLLLFPWLIPKCRWVMLGGDVYYYRDRPKRPKAALYEFARARVIPRIPFFLSYFRQEYELLRDWYDVRGDYLECLLYPNIFSMPELPPATPPNTPEQPLFTFMVGNAARSGNRHFECFDRILAADTGPVRVICPLSYGQPAYGQQVKARGQALFAERFIALEDYLSLEAYAAVLRQVDAALFGVDRQQSMATVLLLLSLGVKVYMRSDITPFAFFSSIDVKVFPLESVDGQPLAPELARRNVHNIRNFFNPENAIAQWRFGLES